MHTEERAIKTNDVVSEPVFWEVLLHYKIRKAARPWSSGMLFRKSLSASFSISRGREKLNAKPNLVGNFSQFNIDKKHDFQYLYFVETIFYDTYSISDT